MARKLLNIISNKINKLPDNKQFLSDVMSAIETDSKNKSRKPSTYYKPSSMNCARNMYFTRQGATVDTKSVEYNAIGMADTGTRRHEAIQDVLLKMKDMGYDWEYVDVAKYVQEKQSQGKCLNLKIVGNCGAEVHLIDTKLNLSFRCDGIIKKISTGEYFLFEFKNQTSFKYADKQHIDTAHTQQVICYCTILDLDKALVLYENRDVCTLECPEIYEVTESLKQIYCVEFIENVEDMVKNNIVPPKCTDTKTCRWCSYQTICNRIGD